MKYTYKRILSIFTAAALTVCALPQSTPLLLRPAITASAANTSGTCGEDCTWTLGSEGTLTISGRGDMEDYSDDSLVPWKEQKKNIKAAVIGDGVTRIGKNAFDGCSGLGFVTIPESVTSIGECVFYGCTGLKSVTVPAGVTSIEKLTFQGCSGLTEINLPSGITRIGNYAFYGCSGLTAFTIPEHVTSISVNAFAFCSKIEEITIPASVTEIDACVFIDCSDLKTITILNPECEIVYDEFARMVPKTTVIRGYAGSSAQAYAEYFSQAFEEITVPEITASGTCGGNLTWTLDSEGTLSISGSGRMSEWKEGADIPWNEQSADIKCAVIADGVKNIGSCAFEACSALTSIEIPDSVTSIGDSAFYHCSSLTDIEIPNSVFNIGWCVFEGCTALNAVVVPDNVTDIPVSAFYGCSALTSVEIPDGVTRISQGAFSGCSALNSIEIPDSVTSIGEGAFYHCSALTVIELPDSVTNIAYSVFEGCSELNNITIRNAECEIFDAPETISAQTVIRGNAASPAEAYAQKYERVFELLSDATEDSVSDWAEKSVISKGTKEAELVVRVGDIDACNDKDAVAEHGYDPFTAKSQYAHGYPWSKDDTDPAGTDRIFVGSKWNGENTDGYSSNYAAYKNGNDKDNAYGDGALSFTMEYDASEIGMKSVILQLCIDDFQANSWDSVFTVTLNGKDAPFIAELLNHTDQTGPTAYIVSAMIPAGFFADIASGKLTVVIDEITGIGDGYAIDFAKLLINYNDQIFTGSFSGKTEPEATVRLLGTSTTVTASSTGEFTFSAIPGINAVRASKEGFVENYKSGIVLSAGTEWKPEIHLEAGEGGSDIDFSSFAETGISSIKGDLNNDGTVSVEDAQLALLAYVQSMAGLESGLTEQQAKAADINGDKTVSVEDAQLILIYYVSNTISGQNVTWDELLGKKTQALPRLLRKMNILLNLK